MKQSNKLTHKLLFKTILIFSALLIVSACNNKTTVEQTDTTDQMFEEKKENETVYIFQMDGNTYMIEPAYEIGYIGKDLKDGAFYKLVADITYLNGGVAGYVDYPQIDKVIDCVEVSPFDIGLPDISEKRYGVMLIGDYSDGDIFLHEFHKAAIWKDGNWIWQYNKELKNDDGTIVYYQSDVSFDEIEKGINNGILACSQYFVLPLVAGA